MIVWNLWSASLPSIMLSNWTVKWVWCIVMFLHSTGDWLVVKKKILSGLCFRWKFELRSHHTKVQIIFELPSIRCLWIDWSMERSLPLVGFAIQPANWGNALNLMKSKRRVYSSERFAPALCIRSYNCKHCLPNSLTKYSITSASRYLNVLSSNSWLKKEDLRSCSMLRISKSELI